MLREIIFKKVADIKCYKDLFSKNVLEATSIVSIDKIFVRSWSSFLPQN